MNQKRDRTLRRAAAREARKLMRGGMAVGLVALGACGDSRAPDLATSMMTGGGAASAKSDGGAIDRDAPTKNDQNTNPNTGFAGAPDKPMSGTPIRRVSEGTDVVDRKAIARDVLYSWTSQTQIMELRDSPVLLTRSEKSDGTQTQLSTVIAAMSTAGDALAQVLATAAFQKGRYAWSNPWATIRGWPGESYGDQLLRVVLKPEAWIAVVSDGPIRVFDLDNQQISTEDAMANPERIAAAYFLNAGSADPNACGSFAAGCGTGAFREYFINNESMVLEWSFGTQHILDELERSIDVIRGLREEIAGSSVDHSDACEFARELYCTWVGGYELGSKSTHLEAYQHSLALTSEYYTPTLDNLDALLAALKASLFTPDPFEHKP